MFTRSPESGLDFVNCFLFKIGIKKKAPASLVDFGQLIASKKDVLNDLAAEDYLRFGNHVSVYPEIVRILLILNDDRSTF